MYNEHKPWRWTKWRKSLAVLIQAWGVKKTKNYVKRMRMKAAKENGWRRSEIVMTIVEDELEINEVHRRLQLPGVKERLKISHVTKHTQI